MRILCERVEHLEGYFPLPPLRNSPWLPEALMILSDDELDRAGEFFQLAIAGNQSQATPAQWDALAVLSRQEAQLKAQALRRGEPVHDVPILLDVEGYRRPAYRITPVDYLSLSGASTR
jgi:hypothetical protein